MQQDRHEILPDSRKVAITLRTPPNAGYHFSSSRCRRTWNDTFICSLSKINLKQPRQHLQNGKSFTKDQKIKHYVFFFLERKLQDIFLKYLYYHYLNSNILIFS